MSREALEASIEKWRKNSEATAWSQVSVGPDDCPLCLVYNKSLTESHGTCEGCPVMKKTGKPFCHDTPYVVVANGWRMAKKYSRLTDVERGLIMAELAFLEGLWTTGS
jgi:hypothetical protein